MAGAGEESRCYIPGGAELKLPGVGTGLGSVAASIYFPFKAG